MIDRAEDGDGDAVVSDDSPDADRPAVADAGQRAAAHRRYQDTVDHTYDMARVDDGEPAPAEESAPEAADHDDAGPEPDEAEENEADGAWAEAVTELRAAWEKHEQRYPERSRLTPTPQLDGSWLADGDRRLTPEQNAEASKACEDIRAEGTEVIRPALERVEAADPDRRLAGLDHMLKGEDRLKEKVADVLFVEPNLSAKQAADKVTDAVRFTFTYAPERYAEGVQSDVERLKSEGFELIKLKNLWEAEQYKGVNSQWRRPETGLRFEMQFHTPESLEAKELTHQAYERLRGTQLTQAERDELEDYQKRANTRIATPPGATEIEEFPRKHG